MNSLSPEQVNARLQGPGGPITVYLVGAGGCGMSGLGHLLLDLGYSVAGSDLCDTEDGQQLRARGARIHVGHDADQIEQAHSTLVVYSSAVRRDNPELQAARRLHLPIVRRAVLLAALCLRQRSICIAGMHGKTTTTALLAFALEQLGARPSYAIGAAVPQLARAARFETSGVSEPPLFVVETDESDGTLREFQPEIALLLNVDEEHLDYYANLEAVCAEFGQFAAQTRGPVFFCADDTHLAELLARRPGAISYGFNSLSDYRLVTKSQRPESRGQRAEVRPEPAGLPQAERILADSTFEVWHHGTKLGDFSLGLLGEKNISNAGAVIALLQELGYKPPETARAIAGFRGAARRQQELFADGRFRVFDDYGHHPAEIMATMQALLASRPRRLLVAFQPHRFTRTQLLLPQFATAFRGADRLWITEVYAASEPEIAGINGARLAETVRATGQAVEFIPSLEDLSAAVRAALEPGDLVLFLGAGDITKAAQALAARLKLELVTPKERLLSELAARLSPQTVLRSNEPLARRTTLRVGGPADFYVEPSSDQELASVLAFCAAEKIPFTLLGRGSNLLVRDGGIRGVVICLAQPAFSRLEVTGERLRCGAGVRLKAIAVEARRHGLSGLEFLEGIPGSLGGALRMNAGAMGSWLFDVVESVRFMDYAGQIHERPAGEVNVEYRGCPLFRNHIALGAALKGQRASPEAVAERMGRFSKKRWETQPAASSAGCIFKNPNTIPAGKLIDELGLKGTRVGGAVVSAEHGNFIINEGRATARDVLSLIDIIKQRAKSSRGIDLETEVEILGEG